MFFFENEKFEVKVKFFVNINAGGSLKTQCILSINASNTDKNDKNFNLESNKNHGEVSEILRIKAFKLKFPFLKAHSITNIANENMNFLEINQISDQVSKVNKNNLLSLISNFRFGDQFQFYDGNKSFFFFLKTFGKTILNQ